MKLDARIGREGLAVSKRDLDVVHLEIAAGDFEFDRGEPAFTGAHQDGVMIERKVHASSAQQFPIGGGKRQENEGGEDGAHAVPPNEGTAGRCNIQRGLDRH